LTLQEAFSNPNGQVQATKTLHAGAAPVTGGGYVIPRRKSADEPRRSGRSSRTRRRDQADAPHTAAKWARADDSLRRSGYFLNGHRSQGEYLRSVPPEVPVVESEELLEAAAEPTVECSIELTANASSSGQGRSGRASSPVGDVEAVGQSCVE
jgi:hypothetical protein